MCVFQNANFLASPAARKSTVVTWPFGNHANVTEGITCKGNENWPEKLEVRNAVKRCATKVRNLHTQLID